MSHRGPSPDSPRPNLLRRRRLPAEVYRRRRIATGILGMFALVIVYQLVIGIINFAGGFVTSEPSSSATQTPTKPAPTDDNTPSASPTEILACDLENIEVKVEVTGGPQFTAEETLIVTATIRNKGTTTCRRDVGSQSNEIYVQDASSKVVWSSDRCPVSNEKALVNMLPGSKYRIRLEWNGTSNPTQCDRQGSHVAAGEYSVIARNGNATSKPAIINFT